MLANVLLDGIFREDLKLPESEEAGVRRTLKPTFPTHGTITFDGKPLAGAVVTFHPADPTILRPVRADGITAEDGSFTLSAYTANDGAPIGKYRVTVVMRHPGLDVQGQPFVNPLPEKYSKTTTSGLEATVTEGANEFRLELSGR